LEAQDALDAHNAAWEATANNFEALIRRLQKDIAAIEAAEKFVQSD
jgi:hypothetical protein